MKGKTSSFYLALLVLLALTIGGISLPLARAQGPNRVGLVVRFGDDSVITRCIEFSEPQINGYDVLMRSGLNVIAVSSSMGTAVCKIEDEGCPASDCFCQCKGSTCIYWSYWHLVDGSWQYSPVGVSGYTAHPGDVEGWSWGTGKSPPVLSFDQICAPPPTPTPTDTPLPTATWTPSPIPTPTGTPLPTATWTPLPIPTPTDTPSPAATQTSLPTPTNSPLPTATWTPSPAPTTDVAPLTTTPLATDTPSPTMSLTPTDTPVPAPTPTSTLTNTPEPTQTEDPTNTPLPSATPTVKLVAPIVPTPTQIAMVAAPSDKANKETAGATLSSQQRSGLSREAINLILFFALLLPLLIGWIVVQIREQPR